MMVRLISRSCLSILALCISGSSFGGEHSYKVSGQVRVDHRTTKVQVDDARSVTTAGFYLTRSRLSFEGTDNKHLSYRMKYYLERSHLADSNSADGVAKGLSEARLAHKINDNLSLELGRLEIQAFSIEADYSSIDAYAGSQMVITRHPGSGNGAAAVGSFAGQTFRLQVVNSPGFEKTEGKSDYKVEDNHMYVGLSWLGDLADGTVQPIVTAASATRRDRNTKTKVSSASYNANLFGAGARVICGDVEGELEVDHYRNSAYKANTDIDVKSGQVSVTSSVGVLRYKMPSLYLVGILRMTQDWERYSDNPAKEVVKTNKKNAVLEYRPYADLKFRYHVSIERADSITAFSASKPDVSTQSTTLIAGAAASI